MPPGASARLWRTSFGRNAAMSRATPPVIRSASVRRVASIARWASPRVIPPACSTVVRNEA